MGTAPAAEANVAERVAAPTVPGVRSILSSSSSVFLAEIREK